MVIEFIFVGLDLCTCVDLICEVSELTQCIQLVQAITHPELRFCDVAMDTRLPSELFQRNKELRKKLVEALLALLFSWIPTS